VFVWVAPPTRTGVIDVLPEVRVIRSGGRAGWETVDEES